MALKNAGIAAANPLAKVNNSYINALYKEAMGRDATAAELAKFAGRTVKDASNIILAANSPFKNYKAPTAPTAPQAPQQQTPAAPAPTPQAVQPMEQPITPFSETFNDNLDQYRSLGDAFLKSKYDEMTNDLLTEKYLWEKGTLDQVETQQLQDLQNKTAYNSQVTQSYLDDLHKRGLDNSGGKMDLEQAIAGQDYNTKSTLGSKDALAGAKQSTLDFNARVEEMKKAYGVKEGGKLQYGYEKDGVRKFGIGQADQSGKDLEAQGYKFFGSNVYNKQRDIDQKQREMQRTKQAEIESYALNRRQEDRNAYETRRQQYYQSRGYVPQY